MGPGLARTRTGFGFLGSRAGAAVAGAGLASPRLGAGLSSRPGTGMMTPLVATGTRPIKKHNRGIKPSTVAINPLHDRCLRLVFNCQKEVTSLLLNM